MYELHLKGTVTSKRVITVPVIRRWRLVWERRELGTKVDKIDRTFLLGFDSWEAIPEGGIELPLPSKLTLVVKRVLGGKENGLYISALIYFQTAAIDASYRVFPIPSFEEPKVIAWHTEPWKGVKLDIEGTLYFSP